MVQLLAFSKDHRSQPQRRRRSQGDLRDRPIFTLTEAASYLRIPATTLRQWIVGRPYPTSEGERYFEPLIKAADLENGLLSFWNLAEAHVLQATRDRRIGFPAVRHAIDYVASQWPGPHPLLSQEFYHLGREIFVKRVEEGQTINASRGGQLAIREILDEALKRLERDGTGAPIRIRPLRSEHLVLDINIASGQPTVEGTGILAAVLFGRNRAGDSVEDLAADYKIDPGYVQEAIDHFTAA